MLRFSSPLSTINSSRVCTMVMKDFVYVHFAVDSAKVLEALLAAVKSDDTPIRFGKCFHAVFCSLQIDADEINYSSKHRA